jgi:Tol biopolymer transport system component
METQRPVPTPYPASTGIPSQPVWAPDSRTVAYTKGAPPNLYFYDIAGGGGEKRVFETHDSLETEDWSPGGRYILYTVGSVNDLSPQGGPNFVAVPDRLWRFARSLSRRTIYRTSHPGFVRCKWIAFTSAESGQSDIYVEPFRAGGTRQRVSPRGG